MAAEKQGKSPGTLRNHQIRCTAGARTSLRLVARFALHRPLFYKRSFFICGRGIVRPLIPRGDTHFAQEAGWGNHVITGSRLGCPLTALLVAAWWC
jgi:hypothetical protein